MSKIIFILLLIVGFLVPDHIPPWQAFHNEAPVFIGLIAALFGACFLPRQRASLRWKGIGIPLLFIGVSHLQWVSGLLPFGGDVFLVTIYGLGFGLAWALGFGWRENGGAFSTLAITFILVACVSSIFALIQWTELDEFLAPWLMSIGDSGRALGNVGQPNQLATLLLMGVVATWVLQQQGRLAGLTAILLVMVMSVGIVLSQSRAALLSAFVLPIACHLAPQKLRSKISVHDAWIWVCVLLIATVAYRYFRDISSLYISTNAGVDGGGVREIVVAGTRPLMWKQILAGLSESPWLGYGFMQVATAQQHGAIMIPGLEQTNYSHNLVLDIAVWYGIPVGVVVTGIGAYWVVRRWSNASSVKTIYAFLWLLPLAVHSLLEFPFAYAYFLFPAALVLGEIDCETSHEANRQAIQSPKTMHWSFLCFSLVFFGLTSWVGWEYLRVERDFNIARFENRRIGRTPDEYALPNFWALSQWGTVLHAMRLRAEPGMTQDEIETLRRASQRFSWAALHMRYALALALNGESIKARGQMLLIRNLFGPVAYSEAKDAFLSLQQEKYPELGNIILP